jgi:integrase
MTRIKLEYVHEYRSRGRTYYYFRRRGYKQVALNGLPGSAEFMAAYQEALSASQPKEIGANRTKPGTVNAAIVGYYTCLAFRELAPGTQVMRRRILEKFRAEHGDKQIATLPQQFIHRMTNQMKPGQARNWLKALRHLLDFAVSEKFRTDNPARGFKLAKMKSKNRRAWTGAEILQYEAAHPVGSRARLAFALGLYTVQRVSDVIRMGRGHVRAGDDGPELLVQQQKTGVRLTLPILPALQTILDATPSGHMTFLVTKSGRRFDRVSFSTRFRAWCDEAGLPQDCVFHGLRATGCTFLADAGYSTPQIAAWSGHTSLKEVERYTRARDQRLLARSATAWGPKSEQPVANTTRKSG